MQIIEATREAIAGASLQKTSHTQTLGKQETTGAAGFRYIFQVEDDWEPAANTKRVHRTGPKRSLEPSSRSKIHA